VIVKAQVIELNGDLLLLIPSVLSSPAL